MQNYQEVARNRRARSPRLLPLGLALLLALPLSALLAGCGGGGSSSAPSQTPAPAAPLSVSAVMPSGLTLMLTENTATVPVGGNVNYTLTLTNGTSQSISVRLVSGCGYNVTGAVSGELAVLNKSGANILNLSGGGCGGIATPVTPTVLSPGQSLSGTVTSGNVFSAAGQYSATGSIVDVTNTEPQSTTVGPLTVTAQ